MLGCAVTTLTFVVDSQALQQSMPAGYAGQGDLAVAFANVLLFTCDWIGQGADGAAGFAWALKADLDHPQPTDPNHVAMHVFEIWTDNPSLAAHLESWGVPVQPGTLSWSGPEVATAILTRADGTQVASASMERHGDHSGATYKRSYEAWQGQAEASALLVLNLTGESRPGGELGALVFEHGAGALISSAPGGVHPAIAVPRSADATWHPCCSSD